MSQLVWDTTGKRVYETGIDRGVLYPRDNNGLYPQGYSWNGLISVTESPSGAEASPFYSDNIKYLNLISLEELGLTIEAFTYPKEFGSCDGSSEAVPGLFVGQQSRKSFGFAYRTILGNDISRNGYKLHLIYGALANPSEKAYATINDASEAITFSWAVATTPISMINSRSISSLVIDSTKVEDIALAELERILYGVSTPISIEPRLPLPSEVINILLTAGLGWIVGTSVVGIGRIN